MRQWIVSYSERHPVLCAVAVVIAMLLGLADGLWSLYEKLAPIAQPYVPSLDWSTLGAGWVPWVTTPVGLVLLALIYRQNRTSERYIRGQTILIAALANDQNRVLDRVFEDCVIAGPAVLAFMPRNALTECTFVGPAELLMVAPVGMLAYGVIALDRCAFYRCRFEKIGVVGTRAEIDRIKANLGGLPQKNQPS